MSNIKTDSFGLIWNCEFCNHVNKLESTSINEIPTKEDVTYLIKQAESANTINSTTESLEDLEEKDLSKLETTTTTTNDNFLTYCIDISGSMDYKIPGSNASECITRLKGVKIACLENLNELKEKEPNKKCSLVTFNNFVKYYGDGSKLSNQEPLVNVPEKSSSSPFSFNYNNISNKGSLFGTSLFGQAPSSQQALNNNGNNSIQGSAFGKFSFGSSVQQPELFSNKCNNQIEETSFATSDI